MVGSRKPPTCLGATGHRLLFCSSLPSSASGPGSASSPGRASVAGEQVLLNGVQLRDLFRGLVAGLHQPGVVGLFLGRSEGDLLLALGGGLLEVGQEDVGLVQVVRTLSGWFAPIRCGAVRTPTGRSRSVLQVGEHQCEAVGLPVQSVDVRLHADHGHHPFPPRVGRVHVDQDVGNAGPQFRLVRRPERRVGLGRWKQLSNSARAFGTSPPSTMAWSSMLAQRLRQAYQVNLQQLLLLLSVRLSVHVGVHLGPHSVHFLE